MATKKKRSQKNGESDDEFFTEGTPLDELGMPLSNVEVPVEDARHLPLDTEASRVTAEYRNAVSKKGRGETGVQFNAPDRVKYDSMIDLHPEARVRIFQVDPETDENFPERLLTQVPNYEALRAYIADNHWNGEGATYKWEVHSGRNPWAYGKISFRESEMKKYGPPQQQSPYGQQQMPPPHGVTPYFLGAPPQVQPVFVHQPQQPQPQQPAPQPQVPAPAPQPIQMPPGIDPTLGALLSTILAQLNDANARNAALTAQLQYYAQAAPQQQQQPIVVAPQAPPPPPKSPIEMLSEISGIIAKVNDFRNSVSRDEGPSEPEPPSFNPDSPFTDLGPIRAVRSPDGSFFTPGGQLNAPLLANIDKYEGLLNGAVDKIFKMFDKLGEKKTQQIREQVGLMKEAEEIANRANARSQYLQNQQQQPAPRFSPAAAPQPEQPLPSPAPAPPPFVHPWERFGTPDKPVEQPVADAQVVETSAEVAD